MELAESSLTVVMTPAVVRVGASLTALTVTKRLSVRVLMPPFAVPPLSTTVQVMFPEPLALAIVLYVSP